MPVVWFSLLLADEAFDFDRRAQVAELNSAVRRGLSPRQAAGCVEINTVDGFQGREKDIIVFSCVRSSAGGIGFLAVRRPAIRS